jgi:hypothetical protein
MNKKIFRVMNNVKLLLLALFVIVGSCVPAELDSIQAFEFTFPGLEIVDPLPEVVITEPVAVVETDGDITIPVEADELVSNVVASVVTNDITQENLDLIQAFSEIAPNISDAVVIDGLTEAVMSGILDGSIQPSADFLQIQADFKANPEFVKYFSQLELPTVDGSIPGARLTFDKRETIKNEFNSRIGALVGPCKETADEIYLRNVKKLEDESVVQIQGILTNYLAFTSQYEQDYAARIILGAELIADNTTELLDFAVSTNKAIDELDYPDAVKRGLKSYIIAFVLGSKDQLIQFEESFAIAAEFARDKRITASNVLRDGAILIAETNLNSAILIQTTNYNTAVNNCHNQGAGG